MKMHDRMALMKPVIAFRLVCVEMSRTTYLASAMLEPCRIAKSEPARWMGKANGRLPSRRIEGHLTIEALRFWDAIASTMIR